MGIHQVALIHNKKWLIYNISKITDREDQLIFLVTQISGTSICEMMSLKVYY